MINRTRFKILDVKGNCYIASGYLKEVGHELLFWDLEIDPAGLPALFYANQRTDFIINDITYVDIALRIHHNFTENGYVAYAIFLFGTKI